MFTWLVAVDCGLDKLLAQLPYAYINIAVDSSRTALTHVQGLATDRNLWAWSLRVYTRTTLHRALTDTHANYWNISRWAFHEVPFLHACFLWNAFANLTKKSKVRTLCVKSSHIILHKLGWRKFRIDKLK